MDKFAYLYRQHPYRNFFSANSTEVPDIGGDNGEGGDDGSDDGSGEDDTRWFGLFDWLSSIKEGIGNLPQNFANSIIKPILNGIKAIFIPDADFISNRWNSIASRFSFAKSITETADILIRFFKDTAFNEPPKVYIDLGYAESKYDYGGQTYCLDMSWYARYKPIVDVFLSAWIWITFIWRVYTHLPNIINGVAGGFDVVADVQDYDNYNKYGHKFSNSYGEFRNERRELRRFINFRRFRK